MKIPCLLFKTIFISNTDIGHSDKAQPIICTATGTILSSSHRCNITLPSASVLMQTYISINSVQTKTKLLSHEHIYTFQPIICTATGTIHSSSKKRVTLRPHRFNITRTGNRRNFASSCACRTIHCGRLCRPARGER